MTKLILVRGLPGSGKSTLAKLIAGSDGSHYEADMYFIDCDGNYNFDINFIGDAHAWCQDATFCALEEGKTVVVSNTFTTIRELRPYFDMAQEMGIVPTVIVAQNQFKDVHNVPEEAFLRMKNRFTMDITPLFDYLNEVQE